ncbi:MAG TPA: hypothetical protein VF950_24870 [Planctomycetota bacterium]
MADDFFRLPAGLPVPVQDGACDHLPGKSLPRLSLPSTSGGRVELDAPGRAIYFVYPRTGVPGQPTPEGWNDIPGARG